MSTRYPRDEVPMLFPTDKFPQCYLRRYRRRPLTVRFPFRPWKQPLLSITATNKPLVPVPARKKLDRPRRVIVNYGEELINGEEVNDGDDDEEEGDGEELNGEEGDGGDGEENNGGDREENNGGDGEENNEGDGEENNGGDREENNGGDGEENNGGVITPYFTCFTHSLFVTFHIT